MIRETSKVITVSPPNFLAQIYQKVTIMMLCRGIRRGRKEGKYTGIKLLNGSSCVRAFVCMCMCVCMSEGVENVYLWNLCLFLVVKKEDKSLPTPSFITIPSSLLYTSYEMCAVPTVTYYLPYLTVQNFSFTFLHQNMSSSVVASYRITSSLVQHQRPVQHPLYLLTYTRICIQGT